MIIMTKVDFLERLKKHNIDVNRVVFDDPIKEGYCIRKNHLRWEVCYRERGKEYNCMGFPSESDALQYLFDELCNKTGDGTVCCVECINAFPTFGG